MNLYVDTSALVKLYVDEAGREAVLQATRDAEIIGTCVIAYVEARAAFARRRREGGLTTPDHRRCVRSLDRDWPHYLRMELAEDLVLKAGRIAERYHLRAYDAVHLTAALAMRDRLGEVAFACWDAALNASARRAGLVPLPG